MFGGPLQTKTEVVKCNYLMIWAGEKGRQIFSTWNLEDDDKGSSKVITLGSRATASQVRSS